MADADAQIERFASDLIKYVRDRAIHDLWTVMSQKANDPTARRWRQAGVSPDSEAMLRTVIPDVVDSTIFMLLDAIDNHRLRILVVQDGKTVDLYEAGMSELGMEYAGSEWCRKYSKEPFYEN